MTFSIVYQAARPVMVSLSKRSLALPMRTFSTQEVNPFEQAHHQVAPLIDSTIYAPQGHSTTEIVASTTETIFTPSVNAVFDD